MNEWEKLLAAAKQELEGGADPRRIDEAIRQSSGLPNFRALSAKVSAAKLKAESDAGLRAAEHSPMSNFGREVFQGATLGWGDELIGLLGGNAAGSRQRLADIETAEPGASLAAQGIGAMLLPGAGAKAAYRAGGLLKAAAVGAGVGGAAGAVGGAGSAEPGVMNRLHGALSGAETGAALGGALVPLAAGAAKLGGALRRLGQAPNMAAGRGQRVAAELERLSHSGINREINKAIEEANGAVSHIREKLYKPMGEAHKVVDDPEILRFLRNEDVAPQARAAVRGITDEGRPTSFTELQRVRTRLRRNDRDLAGQLNEMMQQKFPGLEEADAAYSKALGRRRAFNVGRKVTTYKIDGEPAPLRNAQDIDRVRASMPPEARQAFDQGRLVEAITELEKQHESAPALLNQMMDAGPETRNQLRSLFPNEENFQSFMSFLQGEKAAEMKALTKADRVARVWQAFKTFAKYGSAGAVGGWALRRLGLFDLGEGIGGK